MSKKNLFELQSEVYSRLTNGETSSDLWSDCKERRQDLKHLVGGGNCNLNEYRKEIEGLCKSLAENIKESKLVGPLAERELNLSMQALTLAGSVMRALVSVEPKTIPETEALYKDYRLLAKGVTQKSLTGAIGHLPTNDQDAYLLDVVRLYGEPEVVKPAESQP